MCTALQIQDVVSAYLKSKQVGRFYLKNKQILHFAFGSARQCAYITSITTFTRLTSTVRTCIHNIGLKLKIM